MASRSSRAPGPLRRAVRAGLLAGALASLALTTGAEEEPDPELVAILALDGDAERGRPAYEACAVCHGPEGGGRADGTFPRIAGQHPEVVTKQLVDIRSGRRRNPVMKSHAEALLDRQQVADVVAYLASLRASEPAGLGPGNDLSRGQRLYRRDCATCHGLDGEGDGPSFVPALAGQHAAYLQRQIRAIAGGRRGNSHGEMLRRVRAYSDPELQAVVDYASRLRGAPLR